MTISVYGVGPAIDRTWWALLQQYQADGQRGHGVRYGLAATATTGLSFSISAGRAWAAGTVLDMDAAQTITLGARSTKPRVDTICAQVNWSGTIDTAGSLVVVPGVPGATEADQGNTIGAALTQTTGNVFQVPLWEVLVPTTGNLTLSDARGPAKAERVVKGRVRVTPEVGTYVPFPARTFDNAPEVVITPLSGAGSSTTSNINVVGTTQYGFTIMLHRSTDLNVLMAWIASGT